MTWMLRDNGVIRHLRVQIEDASPVTDAYPKSICGVMLNAERTEYLSHMMFPEMGFRKCKHCLRIEDALLRKKGRR